MQLEMRQLTRAAASSGWATPGSAASLLQHRRCYCRRDKAPWSGVNATPPKPNRQNKLSNECSDKVSTRPKEPRRSYPTFRKTRNCNIFELHEFLLLLESNLITHFIRIAPRTSTMLLGYLLPPQHSPTDLPSFPIHAPFDLHFFAWFC